MTKKELYDRLVCALTHSIDTCKCCNKCGKGVNARLNLIKELSKLFNLPLPWAINDRDVSGDDYD